MSNANGDAPYRLLERVFREEAGRLTASLVRLLGDFDLAEDLVSEAVVEALAHWPREGIPERPAAWLLTTARRKGLDRVRRDAVYREKLALLAALSEPPRAEADDRVRLIFTCCHPALAREAQVALTLRAVCGLTTAEIARAFLVPEATLGKRIVRAKRKIVDAGVPYRVPAAHELRPRLDAVLTVIYLIFNEGYLTTSGAAPLRRDLAQDAEWLAGLVAQPLPDEPEPLGLLAFIRLHLARWPARLDAQGGLVVLERQDRALWDQALMARGVRTLREAAALRRPGRDQVEAAIAAVHGEASSWPETDWPQLRALYTLLVQLDPSPVVRLNRAVVVSQTDGAAAALREIAALAAPLASYHLFHTVQAAFLRALGREGEARAADATALTLARNHAERTLIGERLTVGGP